MTTPRWWMAPILALVPFTVPFSPAAAESVRCDADAAPDALRVYCERHTADRPPRQSGFRPTRTEVLYYGGDLILGCTSGADDGILIRRVTSTWDGIVVLDRFACVTLPPPVNPGPSDAELAEAVSGSRRWPELTVGTNPSARGLVAYPFELVCSSDVTIAVGPLVLSDGTSAVGTARVVAAEWVVDGDAVAATTSCESPLAPVGYIWSTAGEKQLGVRLQWVADLAVTSPAGITEQRVIGGVTTEAIASFTVEQVQAVIRYER